MENIATNSIEIIINNPANTLSKSSIDLLRTLAMQSDLNKTKADKWDKLEEIRIGNYAIDSLYGTEVQVTINHFSDDAFNNLEPIPLSEEWLQNLVFALGEELTVNN